MQQEVLKAANEIKRIVQLATNKTKEGSEIANSMIEGYTSLNENISITLDLIQNVTTASKEQSVGMVQINDAVNNLDQITQKMHKVHLKQMKLQNKH